MATRIEKLQDRWERITPRERALIVLLSGTGLVILLSWVASTISGGLDAIEARNRQVRHALQALQVYRGSEHLRQPKGASVVLPKDAIDLRSHLEAAASAAGITIPRYRSQPAVTKGKYREVSTSISLNNLTLPQVKDFLEKVENRKEVAVTELQIRARNKDKMFIELVVSTFHQAGEVNAEDSAGSEG